MSEVKGSLLGIVLTVAVFGIVFGIITVAIKNASETVSSRMDDAAQQEFTDTDSVFLTPTNANYALHY